MLYGHPALFRMCFPNGSKAEEERGYGRALRFSITKTSP
jgi:hypothetical protein